MHLGCFGARGGAGGGWRAFMGAKLIKFFPIRQAVPVGHTWAWICSWAHWAQFFIEKNVNCSKYSIFTYNLVFFKCLSREE